MALARDFNATAIERVQRDPVFAKAMLDEAATLVLNGEPDAARVIVRDLVDATVGVETRAHVTNKNSKSLHRMLSATGIARMPAKGIGAFTAFWLELCVGSSRRRI